jgi:hypothetical protein
MFKLFAGIIFFIISTFVIIVIRIFNIKIPRKLDPHDPMVLLYEILPIILYSVITTLIAYLIYKKIKDNIKNKKSIIYVYLISQLICIFTFTLILETFKFSVNFIIGVAIFIVIQYFIIIFFYKIQAYDD